MSKQAIYKYEIDIMDVIVMHAPRVVRWLDVQVQHGEVCVWAVVDTDSPPDDRVLQLRGTGHPFDGTEGAHIGTFQLDGGALVFHLFETA